MQIFGITSPHEKKPAVAIWEKVMKPLRNITKNKEEYLKLVKEAVDTEVMEVLTSTLPNINKTRLPILYLFDNTVVIDIDQVITPDGIEVKGFDAMVEALKHFELQEFSETLDNNFSLSNQPFILPSSTGNKIHVYFQTDEPFKTSTCFVIKKHGHTIKYDIKAYQHHNDPANADVAPGYVALHNTTYTAIKGKTFPFLNAAQKSFWVTPTQQGQTAPENPLSDNELTIKHKLYSSGDLCIKLNILSKIQNYSTADGKSVFACLENLQKDTLELFGHSSNFRDLVMYKLYIPLFDTLLDEDNEPKDYARINSLTQECLWDNFFKPLGFNRDLVYKHLKTMWIRKRDTAEGISQNSFIKLFNFLVEKYTDTKAALDEYYRSQAELNRIPRPIADENAEVNKESEQLLKYNKSLLEYLEYLPESNLLKKIVTKYVEYDTYGQCNLNILVQTVITAVASCIAGHYVCETEKGKKSIYLAPYSMIIMETGGGKSEYIRLFKAIVKYLRVYSLAFPSSLQGLVSSLYKGTYTKNENEIYYQTLFKHKVCVLDEALTKKEDVFIVMPNTPSYVTSIKAGFNTLESDAEVETGTTKEDSLPTVYGSPFTLFACSAELPSNKMSKFDFQSGFGNRFYWATGQPAIKILFPEYYQKIQASKTIDPQQSFYDWLEQYFLDGEGKSYVEHFNRGYFPENVEKLKQYEHSLIDNKKILPFPKQHEIDALNQILRENVANEKSTDENASTLSDKEIEKIIRNREKLVQEQLDHYRLQNTFYPDVIEACDEAVKEDIERRSTFLNVRLKNDPANESFKQQIEESIVKAHLEELKLYKTFSIPEKAYTRVGYLALRLAAITACADKKDSFEYGLYKKSYNFVNQGFIHAYFRIFRNEEKPFSESKPDEHLNLIYTKIIELLKDPEAIKAKKRHLFTKTEGVSEYLGTTLNKVLKLFKKSINSEDQKENLFKSLRDNYPSTNITFKKDLVPNGSITHKIYIHKSYLE